MSPDLHRCYEILAINRNSTWSEIRTAYRQLAQKWHPDRVEEAQKVEAEKRIKEINQAFSDIEKYYVKFGRPPGDAGLKTPVSDNAVKRKVYPKASVREAPKRTRTENSPLKPHMMFFLLCVFGYILWFLFWPAPQQDITISAPDSAPENQEPLNETEPDSEHSQQIRLFFKIGSTKEEIYGIQGRPGRIKGDLWYYGRSVIFFNNGAVIGWQEDPEFPLHTEERALQGTTTPAERP